MRTKPNKYVTTQMWRESLDRFKRVYKNRKRIKGNEKLTFAQFMDDTSKIYEN